jgi:hypothetical protein
MIKPDKIPKPESMLKSTSETCHNYCHVVQHILTADGSHVGPEARRDSWRPCICPERWNEPTRLHPEVEHRQGR